MIFIKPPPTRLGRSFIPREPNPRYGIRAGRQGE